jgi:hypothetical protein
MELCEAVTDCDGTTRPVFLKREFRLLLMAERAAAVGLCTVEALPEELMTVLEMFLFGRVPAKRGPAMAIVKNKKKQQFDFIYSPLNSC